MAIIHDAMILTVIWMVMRWFFLRVKYYNELLNFFALIWCIYTGVVYKLDKIAEMVQKVQG